MQQPRIAKGIKGSMVVPQVERTWCFSPWPNGDSAKTHLSKPQTLIEGQHTEGQSQDVGGTLIGEDGLVIMAGAELVEWYQIHQTHGFHVFDTIPFVPFQPLLRAILPSAASTEVNANLDNDKQTQPYSQQISMYSVMHRCSEVLSTEHCLPQTDCSL